MALAVGPGVWLSTPQVHESTGDYQELSLMDWESMDGARGAQFSDPPQTWSGYPMFATSDLPGTWPPGGWPAPEAETDVWWGTDTWLKWEERADKEIYCEFDDTGAARNPHSSVLDITVRKRVLGYGSLDGAIFQFELTNNSSNTYTGCFIGQFGDLGSPVYNSWIGFPRADLSRSMTYNIGASYNAAAGTHRCDDDREVPFFGFVMLESPTGSYKTVKGSAGQDSLVDNPDLTMQRLALTHWEDATYDPDPVLYGALTGYTQYMAISQAQVIWKADAAGQNPVLLQDEDDWLTIYDPDDADHYQYRASGEFTFEPGEKINYVMAHVAGGTEGAMIATADKAQKFYQARFKTSGPPPSPTVSAPGLLAGPNGVEFNPDIHSYRIYYAPNTDPPSITLYWEGSVSETEPDPISANVEFQGYKIYKSLNRGGSWGEPVTDNQGVLVSYVPQAQFDLADDIVGSHPVNGFWLGEDTGLQHQWTDIDVMDGFEYWYAITSYDYADVDPITGSQEPAYESARGGDPTTPNVVSVIAGARPAGYQPGALTAASTGALTPTVAGGPYTADGTASVQVLDDAELTGDTYRITTTSGAAYGLDAYSNMVGVTLENVSTSTVLYTGLLPEDLATLGVNLLPVVEGVQVVVDTRYNGIDPYDRTDYTFPPEFLPYGGYEMIYGDDWFMASTLDHTDLVDASTGYFSAEIRFDTTQTQLAYVYNRTGGYQWVGTAQFPGTVWDVSGATDRQVNVAYTRQSAKGTNYDWDIDDDPLGANRHYTSILARTYSSTVDTAYKTGTKSDWSGSELDHVWSMIPGLSDTFTTEFPNTAAFLHVTTAVYSYEHPVGPGWQYEFSTTAAVVDPDSVDIDDIKVVPNPYYVRAEWDRNENRRKIMFTNVPEECRIDIYM